MVGRSANIGFRGVKLVSDDISAACAHVEACDLDACADGFITGKQLRVVLDGLAASEGVHLENVNLVGLLYYLARHCHEVKGSI